MKRDMDLIRSIALKLVDMEYGEALTGLDGADDATFGVHAMWMEEAGLIKATITEYWSNDPPKAHIHRLTWAGCEFADAVRSDTIWKKAREQVIKPAGSFTFDLLRDWLKTEIAQGLPTLRSFGQ